MPVPPVVATPSPPGGRRGEEAGVLAHGRLDVGREPGARDEEEPLALRELLPGGVVLGAVDALVEPALLLPGGQRRQRLDVLRAGPGGTGVAEAEVRDLRRVDGRALHDAEHVPGGPALDVAQQHRREARRGGGLGGRGHLVPGRGHLEPEALERAAAVVDADDLADLRQPVERALAEDGAVVGVGRVLQDALGVAVPPAVLLGPRVEGHELPGLDELAHRRAGVVGLDDVGGVVAGEGEAQGRREVVERLRHPLDGDVGVLRGEGVVELRHLLVLAAADLLVPDGQRDLAEAGDVRLDGPGGRRGTAPAVVVARAGGAGREGEAGGREERRRPCCRGAGGTSFHRGLLGLGRAGRGRAAGVRSLPHRSDARAKVASARRTASTGPSGSRSARKP